jgi:peroxiredoxin
MVTVILEKGKAAMSVDLPFEAAELSICHGVHDLIVCLSTTHR